MLEFKLAQKSLIDQHFFLFHGSEAKVKAYVL